MSDNTEANGRLTRQQLREIRNKAKARKRKRAIVAGAAVLGVAVVVVSGLLLQDRFNVPVANSSYVSDSGVDPCAVFKDKFNECKVSFSVSDLDRDKLVSQSVSPGFNLALLDSIELVYSLGPAESTFPDVVRMKLEDAEKELYKIGVDVSEVQVIDKAELEPGRVVASSLAAGDKVKNGDKVVLTISSEIVDVPDLKGKTKEQVELDFKKLDVSPVFQEEISSEPVGTVVRQHPAPGNVAKGSKVSVFLAKQDKPEGIKVPSLTGLKETEAQTLAATAGFKNITVIKVESSKVKEATVTHVVPGEGRLIKADESLVIVVSVPEGS